MVAFERSKALAVTGMSCSSLLSEISSVTEAYSKRVEKSCEIFSSSVSLLEMSNALTTDQSCAELNLEDYVCYWMSGLADQVPDAANPGLMLPCCNIENVIPKVDDEEFYHRTAKRLSIEAERARLEKEAAKERARG